MGAYATCLLLAFYVAIEAVRELVAGANAEEPIVRIVLNVVALTVMSWTPSPLL